MPAPSVSPPAAGAAAPAAATPAAAKAPPAKAAQVAAEHSAEKTPLAAGTDYLAEYESELDGIDKGEQASPPSGARKNRVSPPPESGKNGAPDKGKGAEGESGEAEVGTEGADKDKTGAEVEAAHVEHEDGDEPGNIRDLRNGYRTLRKRIKEEYKPKVTALEAKVRELEEATKNGANPDLQKEVEQTKARNQELEQEISYANYSSSAEFQEQYHLPYVAAWTEAVNVFSQLQVRIPDGVDEETGNAKFKLRPATQDDLIKLANLPLSEMDEVADQMFGKSSRRALGQVDEVKKMAAAETRALEKARKTASTRIAQQTEAQKENVRKGREMWTTEHKRLSTKYANLFGPRKGDTDGNALLDKGRALAERIFGDDPKLKPKTAEEAVRLHALAYNKIMGHDRAWHLYMKEKQARQEAEKALKGYEESGSPGRATTGARHATTGNIFDDANAEIDSLNVA